MGKTRKDRFYDRDSYDRTSKNPKEGKKRRQQERKTLKSFKELAHVLGSIAEEEFDE